MTFTIAALASEIANDPANLGLLVLSRAGQDQAVANLLNAIGTGTAADGLSYAVFRNDIAPKEVIQAIAGTDFAGATALQIAKLQILFQSAPIDVTLANVRANFAGIFSGASSATTTALTALATRNGSRAEALWGTGTLITAAECSRAR